MSEQKSQRLKTTICQQNGLQLLCRTHASRDGKTLTFVFVFKGTGKRINWKAPEGVKLQWAEKGFYLMTGLIQNLPNLSNNIFTHKYYAIYVLDDYAVNLQDDVC